MGQRLKGAIWPRPYPSQATGCRVLITSLRRDAPPQPDYRPASRCFAGSPWQLSSLSPPALVKVSAAIMFIYAFIGFQPLSLPPQPPSPPLHPTSELARQFLSHKRAWPVDGGSVQPRRVLDWCCLVKEKHTHKCAHEHAQTHTNPSRSSSSRLLNRRLLTGFSSLQLCSLFFGPQPSMKLRMQNKSSP